MHTLLCETAGAIAEPVAGGRPAETAAHGAEIFHVVRQRGGLESGGYRLRTAFDAGGAAVDLQARDRAGIFNLPVLANAKTDKPKHQQDGSGYHYPIRIFHR